MTDDKKGISTSYALVTHKLTPYDFSDLQITGEFDNRPSDFSIVVAYHTSTLITSADGRRCKRSTGNRTVPGRFYKEEMIFHV